MEIKILKKQGYSLRAISKYLGRAVNTVRRYLSTTEPKYKSRPVLVSKLDPYKDHIKSRVSSAHPNWIPATVILREIVELGYLGKIRILQEYLVSLKQKKVEDPLIRFETPEGKQMQVDWAEFKYETIALHAFVAILGNSRTAFVKFVADEKEETLLVCHEDAFDYFGGVTYEILYDNMKTVIIQRDAYQDAHGTSKHRFNATLYDFAKHHGFVPKVCKPYRAKTKGKVERFIRYVRESFFIPLLASSKQANAKLDIATINAELIKWLNTVANKRVHAGTKQRPFDLLELEKPHLRAVGTSYFKSARLMNTAMSIKVPQHDLKLYSDLVTVNDDKEIAA